MELNYSGLYQRGAALTGTSFEQFKKTYIDSRLELDVLRGAISNDEYQTRLKTMLGNPGMSRRELEDFVRCGWGNEMTEIVDIKERAHSKGIVTGILSNMSQFAREILTRNYPRMLATFSPEGPAVYSYLVGAVKPDIKIYQEADRRARELGADKIILVEDKAKYLLSGIKNFGWFGIHLTINQDPQEAIKQVGEEHTGDVKPSDKLFIAKSAAELVQILNENGVKL